MLVRFEEQCLEIPILPVLGDLEGGVKVAMAKLVSTFLMVHVGSSSEVINSNLLLLLDLLRSGWLPRVLLLTSRMSDHLFLDD